VGPAPLTYTGWLSATARHDPDRVAVIDPTVTVTYGELMASAGAVAAGLTDAVTAGPGARVTGEDLRGAVRDRLAGYKVPKRIHVVDSLPLTPSNKLDRAALRARYETS
jgi:acyl-CoA synthetase (AMP-forming)/AMP-acid ligase II